MAVCGAVLWWLSWWFSRGGLDQRTVPQVLSSSIQGDSPVDYGCRMLPAISFMGVLCPADQHSRTSLGADLVCSLARVQQGFSH